jgi:hypothetical protein
MLLKIFLGSPTSPNKKLQMAPNARHEQFSNVVCVFGLKRRRKFSASRAASRNRSNTALALHALAEQT